MKAIILVGGIRMCLYPFSTLMWVGIKDILMIVAVAFAFISTYQAFVYFQF